MDFVLNMMNSVLKVGNYRWWPAKIRAMDELPEQLAKKTAPVGSFAVCYYGTRARIVIICLYNYTCRRLIDLSLIAGTNEWGFQSHACTVSWEKGDERRSVRTHHLH